jgi:hypothetical protein
MMVSALRLLVASGHKLARIFERDGDGEPRIGVYFVVPGDAGRLVGHAPKGSAPRAALRRGWLHSWAAAPPPPVLRVDPAGGRRVESIFNTWAHVIERGVDLTEALSRDYWASAVEVPQPSPQLPPRYVSRQAPASSAFQVVDLENGKSHS